MTDNDSLMIISDDEQDIKKFDEDESRLYIDENIFDSMNNSSQQSTKSTNTGNAFELDLILIANINRYQTRSSQTILTSNTSLLIKQNRSTFCQAEYFSTITQETNTDHMNEEDEERISKKIHLYFSFFFLNKYFRIMDGAGGNPSGGGGGGGFDPCECINILQMNHEHAMNRLTNLLRNAQTTCTDTECFTGPLPGQPNTDGGNTGISHMYLIIAIWLAIAFLLFIFRPRTLRNNREHPNKPNNQDPHHDNQDPPGPEVH
ncbi:unnamed protein product [Rotaria sordida]|uniref:Small integral membrane protein 14 n=2 Tax=Rotaria sordida TaxID=392033 RepID=A0A813YCU0_9BILA|nr:unnamed protein product [Rotaria sordida]